MCLCVFYPPLLLPRHGLVLANGYTTDISGSSSSLPPSFLTSWKKKTKLIGVAIHVAAANPPPFLREHVNGVLGVHRGGGGGLAGPSSSVERLLLPPRLILFMCIYYYEKGRN